MADLFISHVEEDGDVAAMVARGLEEAGYTSWFYERDSHPGPDYLDQVDRAICEARAVILVISSRATESHQVEDEVKWAREQGKRFVPLLKGISWSAFQNLRPRWRMALGIAAAIDIPSEDVSPVIPRVIAGLRALGITSGAAPTSEAAFNDARGAASCATPSPGAAHPGRFIAVNVRLSGGTMAGQGALLGRVKDAVTERLIVFGHTIIEYGAHEFVVEIWFSSPGGFGEYSYEVAVRTNAGATLASEKGVSHFRGSFVDFPEIGAFVDVAITDDPAALIDLLVGQDVTARTSAALALRQMPRASVVSALTDAMTSDNITAANAASSIVSIAGSTLDCAVVQPFLVACNDPAWVDRVRAAKHVEHAFQYSDAASRRGAAWLAGEAKLKATAPALAELVSRERDASVKQVALEAIAKLKTGAGLPSWFRLKLPR